VTPSRRQSHPPLARLFAIAYRQLIDGLHERLAARGWEDVRPAFGFVLLAARDQPTTSTALAALLGTTKQATSKLVANMETAGYVARSPGEQDGRTRLVTLTRRGRELLDAVEGIYAELESEWAEVVGDARIEDLRGTLARVVADPQGALPPVRPPG
jgi:DNA-binding MarR family transcriptional regulator